MNQPLVDELDRLIEAARAEAQEARKRFYDAQAEWVRLTDARKELTGRKQKAAGRPPKMLATLALVVIGLMLPTAAQAQTTVSPDKQAELDMHGWTAGDADLLYPNDLYMEPFGRTGDCAWSHARRAGAAIRDYDNSPLVWIGAKGAVCANGGHITKHSALVWRHRSPGDDPGDNWSGIPNRWVHYSHWRGNAFEYVAAGCFRYGHSDFSDWWVSVRIQFGVKSGTDHQIWDRVHRNVRDC